MISRYALLILIILSMFVIGLNAITHAKPRVSMTQRRGGPEYMVSNLLGLHDLDDKRPFDDSQSGGPSITKKKRTPSAVDVVIVGAGYSGLYSARQLTRAGYSVAVVEARDRLGGRSLREEITPPGINAPLWVDEGGMWVGPTQTMFLDLLDEYKLPRYLSYHGMGKVAMKWKDQVSMQEGPCWDCLIIPREGESESPEPMKRAIASATGELKEGLEELVRVMTLFRELVDTVSISSPWLTPGAEELDDMTFESWVHNVTKNPLARLMMVLAGSEQGAIAEPWWCSTLHVARQLAAAPQTDTPERWLIKGAAGQVPALLAADVEKEGGWVLLDSPVHLITQHPGGVEVHTESDVISASAVIVAMPPHLTGRIRYDPPVPPARDQLTQRVFMGSIIKCIAVYEEPWWRADPTTNMSFAFDPASHGAMRVAFDITPPKDIGGGGSGVLATFVTETSPELFYLTEEERRDLVLQAFAKFYGSRALRPTAFVQKNWAEDPYTGGAYSSVMPLGTWTSFGEAWDKPVGRIFWAGTEVSTRWPGFYEGALHSGAKAVADVMKEIGSPTGEYKGRAADHYAKRGGLKFQQA